MNMMSNFGVKLRQKLARGYSGYHWKLSLAGLSSLALTAGIVTLADKPVQAKLGNAHSAQPAVVTSPTPSPLAAPSSVESGKITGKIPANPTLAAATAALARHKLEGIASWYGAVLNGHRTASGE